MKDIRRRITDGVRSIRERARVFVAKLRQPRWVVTASVILAVSLFFVFHQSAHAAFWDSVKQGFIGWFVQILTVGAWIIAQLLAKLLALLVLLMVHVASYQDFVDSTAVTKAWVIVRDIFNMILVLMTLYTAVGTLLGLKATYQWDKALPQIIGAAVMVNFSKTIAGIVIDVGQVLMLTFVNAFKNIAAGNLLNAIGMDKMFTLKLVPDVGAPQINMVDIIGSYALVIWALVIANVVVAALIAFFVTRIVWLWVLVAVSPMGFLQVAESIPGLGGLSKKWWSQLTDKVFSGIGVAFLLWLSFAVMQTAPGQPVQIENLNTTGSVNSKDAATGATSFNQQDTGVSPISFLKPENLLSYVIAIVMLGLSLSLAQGLGDWAGEVAKRGEKFAKKTVAPALLAGATYGVSPVLQRKFEAAQTVGKNYLANRKAARDVKLAENTRMYSKGAAWAGKKASIPTNKLREMAAQQQANGNKFRAVALGIGATTAGTLTGVEGADGSNLFKTFSVDALEGQTKQITGALGKIENAMKEAGDDPKKQEAILNAFKNSGSQTERLAAALHTVGNPKSSTDDAKDAKKMLDAMGNVILDATVREKGVKSHPEVVLRVPSGKAVYDKPTDIKQPIKVTEAGGISGTSFSELVLFDKDGKPVTDVKEYLEGKKQIDEGFTIGVGSKAKEGEKKVNIAGQLVSDLDDEQHKDQNHDVDAWGGEFAKGNIGASYKGVIPEKVLLGLIASGQISVDQVPLGAKVVNEEGKTVNMTSKGMMGKMFEKMDATDMNALANRVRTQSTVVRQEVAGLLQENIASSMVQLTQANANIRTLEEQMKDFDPEKMQDRLDVIAKELALLDPSKGPLTSEQEMRRKTLESRRQAIQTSTPDQKQAERQKISKKISEEDAKKRKLFGAMESSDKAAKVLDPVSGELTAANFSQKLDQNEIVDMLGPNLNKLGVLSAASLSAGDGTELSFDQMQELGMKLVKRNLGNKIKDFQKRKGLNQTLDRLYNAASTSQSSKTVIKAMQDALDKYADVDDGAIKEMEASLANLNRVQSEMDGVKQKIKDYQEAFDTYKANGPTGASPSAKDAYFAQTKKLTEDLKAATDRLASLEKDNPKLQDDLNTLNKKIQEMKNKKTDNDDDYDPLLDPDHLY